MSITTTKKSDELLTIHEVMRKLAIGRSTLIRGYLAGRIPKPVKLSARLLRWKPDVLEAWIEAGCLPVQAE